jgi:hypothetical protein
MQDVTAQRVTGVVEIPPAAAGSRERESPKTDSTLEGYKRGVGTEANVEQGSVSPRQEVPATAPPRKPDSKQLLIDLEPTEPDLVAAVRSGWARLPARVGAVHNPPLTNPPSAALRVGRLGRIPHELRSACEKGDRPGSDPDWTARGWQDDHRQAPRRHVRTCSASRI